MNSKLLEVRSHEALFIFLAQELAVATMSGFNDKQKYEDIIAPVFLQFNKLVNAREESKYAIENWFFSQLTALYVDVSRMLKKPHRKLHEELACLVWDTIKTTQAKYELRFGGKQKK